MASTVMTASEDGVSKQYDIMDIHIVSKDPIHFFRSWYSEAKSIPENVTPEAMTLATTKPDGGPAARTLLLRGLDENGFKLYSDSRSPKAGEINHDSRAALVFHWIFRDTSGNLGNRQVRVEGHIEKLSNAEIDDYFSHEPLLAQIRAVTCHQSRVVTDNREALLKSVRDTWSKSTSGQTLSRPTSFQGYRLVPNMMEFYEGQRDAINDRLRFIKTDGNNGWLMERLEP